MGGGHCASQGLLALILHLHLKKLSSELYFKGLAAIFTWFCDAPGKDLIGLASDQQAEASSQAELAFGISRQGCDSTPVDLIFSTIDIDILWPPTVAQGKTFCCTGCAAGGPCNCDYSQYHSVNISGVIHYLE